MKNGLVDLQQGFERFMHQGAKAASAYVNGDPSLVDAIATRIDDATFFPPNGGYASGAKQVLDRYVSDAGAFSSGVTTFHILHSGASNAIGYWPGFQNADVSIGGQSVKMKLRITEIFTLQDGEWKLIHRRADTSADPKPRK